MKRMPWITLILGVWLVVAPVVLGYAGTPLTLANDVVIGIVFVAGSFWIITSFSAEVGAATFETLCSAWLVISPFALGFQPWPRAMVNDVVVGIATLMTNTLTLWTAARSRVKTM